MLKETIMIKVKNLESLSLNPYFNGTCSKSGVLVSRAVKPVDSLNPYFNGTCSKRTNPHLLI